MVGRAPDGWDVSLGRAAVPAHSLRPIAHDLPPDLLAVRHIGPRRARRLIDGLGEDWERLVDQNPQRVFGTLRGVGPVQAAAASESWATRSSASAAGSIPPEPRGA